MKILVTGAAGFIGRYLTPELIAKGHSVVATDLFIPEHAAAPVQWAIMDVSRQDNVYQTVHREKPDCIIHLASLLGAPSDADPVKAWGVNFLSTQYLLDAGSTAGLKRFIFTSSISIYGKGLPEPVADNALKEPGTIYGHTKLAGEHLLRWYQATKGIFTQAVRFPWVFGPGRVNGITALYSSKNLDTIARRQPLTINNPDETGDWLYVRDAVKALLMMLARDTMPQPAYNIMGELHTIRQAMDTAKKICPDANISYVSGPPSENPYPLSYDDSLARKELGWKPDYTLEQGIREHISMVRGQ